MTKYPRGTLARVARQLGISRSAVTKYVQGALKMPARVQAALDAALDPTAPVPRENYILGSAAESADASRQRRAEYRKEMGHVHDRLNHLGSEDDAAVARFTATLAEDEGRYVQRRAARQSAIELARDRLWIRSIQELSHTVFAGRLPRRGYATKKNVKPINRIVNLAIGDTHTGARLDDRELPRGYGWTIASRRLAYVTQQAAEYKPQYRDNSRLVVALLGDLLEGMLLHDIRGGEPLTEQWLACLRYLGHSIAYLASAYPQVDVYGSVGNHGRDKVRHEGRALIDKWDSIEMRLYLALREMLRHIPNVKVHLDMRPYSLVPIFDKWALFTHGDTGLGLPRAPKLSHIAQALSNANAKRHYWTSNCDGTRIYPQIELLCMGHVHYMADTTIALTPDTPGEIVVNGALVPPGGFALDIGVGGSMCGQQLWESTKKWIKGDGRPLKILATEVDGDKSLDKIIPPYEGNLK